MRKTLKILFPLIILALIAGVGMWYFQHKKLYPTTDDAYVKANVVNIAPRITGKIDSVFVNENQFVKKGTLLVTIDPTPFQLAVDKAQAQLEHIKDQIQASQMAVEAAKSRVTQSEAELANTQVSTQRTLTLAKNGYVSKSAADDAVKNLKVAVASLASAKSQLRQSQNERGKLGNANAELRTAQAELAQAQLNLSYTKIYAPADGYIQNFDLRTGASVSAYSPITALVENNLWWIEANFKETDLARIRENQTATIKLDMYPGRIFKGKVMSLSSSSGTTFSLLPAENASGNWVKVTQRFPVRILISDSNNAPLRVGASTTVTIDTQS